MTLSGINVFKTSRGIYVVRALNGTSFSGVTDARRWFEYFIEDFDGRTKRKAKRMLKRMGIG